MLCETCSTFCKSGDKSGHNRARCVTGLGEGSGTAYVDAFRQIPGFQRCAMFSLGLMFSAKASFVFVASSSLPLVSLGNAEFTAITQTLLRSVSPLLCMGDWLPEMGAGPSLVHCPPSHGSLLLGKAKPDQVFGSLPPAL